MVAGRGSEGALLGASRPRSGWTGVHFGRECVQPSAECVQFGGQCVHFPLQCVHFLAESVQFFAQCVQFWRRGVQSETGRVRFFSGRGADRQGPSVRPGAGPCAVWALSLDRLPGRDRRSRHSPSPRSAPRTIRCRAPQISVALAGEAVVIDSRAECSRLKLARICAFCGSWVES